jgi:DNA-binding response OmpR family regulator
VASDVATPSAKKIFDLLLTDVVLPGQKTGATCTNREPLAPGMPVLFMSGYTENTIVHHGRLDPEFISKPFTREQLSKRLKAVLG